MAENSKIEWTSHTFNPWRGCTKVSTGCKLCYAETLSGRNPKTLGVWGPNGTRVVAAESYWREPVKWNRVVECNVAHGGPRPRVFCASLADVFEDWNGRMRNAQGFSLVKHFALGWTTFHGSSEHADETDTWVTMDDVRRRLFDLIDATPNLDWLLLTKRPENVLRFTYDAWCPAVPGHVSQNKGDGHHWKYPPNVWLGTSVENQATADERIPYLLRTPAAVRFLSCEPLLSEVIMHKYLAQCQCGHGHGFTSCPNTGGVAQTCHLCDCRKLRPLLGWSIIGGESGHGARPFDLQWAYSLVKQCRDASVPVFVKQLGGKPFACEGRKSSISGCNVDPAPCRAPKGDCSLQLRDRKGGDMAEWPADLRVREFPSPNERQP